MQTTPEAATSNDDGERSGEGSVGQGKSKAICQLATWQGIQSCERARRRG
jgi:hypothetical protein